MAKTKVFLFVITKNFNWKVLTKNLITFKRWNGVKDEKFNFLKNPIFRGGGGWAGHKNHYIGGNSLIRRGVGEWTFCRF